jgi:hypothetical protein
MAEEELLERIDKDIINTLTSEERKTFGNPTLRLPKVGDFLLKKRRQKTLNQDFHKLKCSFPPFF